MSGADLRTSRASGRAAARARGRATARTTGEAAARANGETTALHVGHAITHAPSSTDRPAAAILLVHGPTWQRVAAHTTDGLAVVGLLAMAVFFDWVAVAVFAAVLGGSVLVRVLQVPVVLQAALGLGLQAAAWASALQWYERYWWADVLAHFAVTGLIAAAAVQPMRGARMVPAGGDARSRWAVRIVTTCVGTSLAVLWEVAEWIGHLYVSTRIEISPGDTIGDLVAGALGSALAGWVLARRPVHGRG